MITEKTKISKSFPIKIKFYLKKRNMYLFPQGFTSKGTMCKEKYNPDKSTAKNDVYTHDYYWIIYNYHFTWIFFTIIFETRLDESTKGLDYIQKRYKKIDQDDKVIFGSINKN